MQSALGDAAPTVDLSSATAQSLHELLPGLGLFIAEDIVAWRDRHGAFPDEVALTTDLGLAATVAAELTRLLDVPARPSGVRPQATPLPADEDAEEASAQSAPEPGAAALKEGEGAPDSGPYFEADGLCELIDSAAADTQGERESDATVVAQAAANDTEAAVEAEAANETEAAVETEAAEDAPAANDMQATEDMRAADERLTSAHPDAEEETRGSEEAPGSDNEAAPALMKSVVMAPIVPRPSPSVVPASLPPSPVSKKASPRVAVPALAPAGAPEAKRSLKLPVLAGILVVCAANAGILASLVQTRREVRRAVAPIGAIAADVQTLKVEQDDARSKLEATRAKLEETRRDLAKQKVVVQETAGTANEIAARQKTIEHDVKELATREAEDIATLARRLRERRNADGTVGVTLGEAVQVIDATLSDPEPARVRELSGGIGALPRSISDPEPARVRDLSADIGGAPRSRGVPSAARVEAPAARAEHDKPASEPPIDW